MNDATAAWSAPVPSLEELGAVHFVGIGGAGMSGIARILLARGVTVSGSDRRDTPTLLALRALGARVALGRHAAAAGVPDADERLADIVHEVAGAHAGKEQR